MLIYTGTALFLTGLATALPVSVAMARKVRRQQRRYASLAALALAGPHVQV